MIAADRLAELHFTAQYEASSDLDDVNIAHLDPFLRGLLFTDGTVSRALEAQRLSPVAVEAVEQVHAPVPARIARYLDVDEADDCVRRRVIMTSPGTRLSVWAESYVVPDRLPDAFVGSLGDSSQGIGGTLRRLKLEDWRELLWFGLGPAPLWSRASPAAMTLTRFYRIITQERPALVISEAFGVEMHLGQYRLKDSGKEPVADLSHSPDQPRVRTRIIDRERASGKSKAPASD